MASEVDESQLKTIFDPTTLIRKGLCPVTILRGQGSDPLESHSLYFEQHGSGPEKIIFIMGLNSTSFSWEPQVERFGRSGKYSVLVFDNRGVGNSGTPRGPYSTSGMAEDVIVLLDFIGWKEKRGIHVVGTSLGGMIAMELISKIHERVASLTLTVTTAGGYPWHNIPPLKGMTSLLRILAVSNPKESVPIALDMVFPQPWLNSKAEDDPQGRTNREAQTEKYYRRIDHIRSQHPLAAISQMCAGLGHRVTPDRLREISHRVPKVIIVTGDEDHLVEPRNSLYLKKHMPEAEYAIFENTGHGIQLQRPKMLCKLIERVVKEGRERADTELRNINGIGNMES